MACQPKPWRRMAEREGCTRSLRSLRLPSVAEPASASAERVLIPLSENVPSPSVVHGGERGIRTLGPDFVGTHDFQSCPFSLSGISPTQSISSLNQLYLIPLTYRLSPRERDVLAHFVRSASLRSPNPLPLTREGPHPTFTLLCTQSAWLANRSFSIGWRRE
jgi:hypothetical protein